MIEEKYLRAVGILIRDSIRNRIMQNKVKPKTIKKNKKGQQGTTLYESGLLANSIAYQIQGKTIILGTNRKYGRIQHEGGTIKKTVTVEEHTRTIKQAFGKRLKKAIQANIRSHQRSMNTTLPARPYMFIDDNTQSRMVAIIGEAVKVRIKNGLQASN